MKIRVNLKKTKLELRVPDYEQAPSLAYFRPETNHSLLFALSGHYVDASKQNPFCKIAATRWDTPNRKMKSYQGLDFELEFDLHEEYSLHKKVPGKTPIKLGDMELLVMLVADTITELGTSAQVAVAFGHTALFDFHFGEYDKDWHQDLIYLTDQGALATTLLQPQTTQEERDRFIDQCVLKGQLEVPEFSTVIVDDNGKEWTQKDMSRDADIISQPSIMGPELDWGTVDTVTNMHVSGLLDDINRTFPTELMPGASKMNVPFYPHMTPLHNEDKAKMKMPSVFPSYIALDRQPYPHYDAKQLLRLLHSAVHMENMTLERFVRVAQTHYEMPYHPDNDKETRPSKDFFRVVMASITALQLASKTMFQVDGTNRRTRKRTSSFAEYSQIINTGVKKSDLSAAAAAADGGSSSSEFLHTDVLGVWGNGVMTVRDCDDGELPVLQTYKMVMSFLHPDGVSHNQKHVQLLQEYPELDWWAWVLSLFECVPSTLLCQSAHKSFLKDDCHQMAVMINKVTFYNAVSKGCAARAEQMKRDEKTAYPQEAHLYQKSTEHPMLFRPVEEFMEGMDEACSKLAKKEEDTRGWIEKLGMFNVETTQWQTPSLLPAAYRTSSTGQMNVARANRNKALSAFFKSSGKTGEFLFGMGPMIKNLHFENNGEIKKLRDKPEKYKAYSKYRLIISCDVPLELSKKISGYTVENNHPLCTKLMFQSSRRVESNQGQFCVGAYLQELAIDPNDMMLVPVGHLIRYKKWKDMAKKWDEWQWPSTYFNASSRPARNLMLVPSEELEQSKKTGRVIYVDRPVIEYNPSHLSGDSFMNTSARVQAMRSMLLGHYEDRSNLPVSGPLPPLMPPLDKYPSTQRYVDVSSITNETERIDENGREFIERVRQGDAHAVDRTPTLCFQFMVLPGHLQDSDLVGTMLKLLNELNSAMAQTKKKFDLVGFYYIRYNLACCSLPRVVGPGSDQAAMDALRLKTLEEGKQQPFVFDCSNYVYIVRIFVTECMRMYHEVQPVVSSPSS